MLKESRGKGYAMEATKTSLDPGFIDMKADMIYACAHFENKGANHILTKLDFEKTGEFEEPDGICNWYELKRNTYLP